MRNRKNPKVISLAMVIILVMTSLSYGAFSTATTNYTVETNIINTNTELTALGTNLLSGKNPISELSYYNIDQLDSPVIGTKANMTDGDLSTQTGYAAFFGGATLVFDIGSVSNISKILFVSDASGYPMQDYQLYVGNDQTTLFNSENQVLEYINNPSTGNQLFTLSENCIGRYIGIKGITADIYNIGRFQEIGVYSAYTVATNTINTNAELTALGTSLLSGKNPISELSYYGINQLDSPAIGTKTNITDGDLSTQTGYDAFFGGATLVFDIGSVSNISKILFASDAGGYPMQDYQIYVGNDQSTLFNSGNQVLEYNNSSSTSNQLFTFDNSFIGRYIGIKGITADMYNMGRFQEIGVYGTYRYTVETNTINTNAELTALGTSLLSGKNPISELNYYGGNQLDSPAIGTKANMTDGDLSTQTGYDAFFGGATLVFDIGSISNISKILFASDASGYPMQDYQLYIGNNQTTLFNTGNQVLEYNNSSSTSNQLFTFDNSFIGRYIGIKGITADMYNMGRFQEIGVYGMYRYTVATNTINTNAELTALGTSLLSGENPISELSYYGINQLDSPAIGTKVNMTDGDLSTQTGYDAFFGGATLVFDIGSVSNISKILFASDAGGYPMQDYQLYVGNNQTSLFNSGNQVLEYINNPSTGNHLFTLSDNYVGRYIGIKGITADMYNMGRFQEIGVYGSAYSGRTYYIDSINGKDSNLGTNINEPIQTVDKVNSIQMYCGDQFLFKAGGSWSGSITLNGSGNSSSQIIIGKYGTGANPVIDALGNSNATIRATDKEYFTIQDLTLKNTRTTSGGGYYIIDVKLTLQSNLNNIFINNISMSGPDGNDTDGLFNSAINVEIYEQAYPYHYNVLEIKGCSVTDYWGNGINFTHNIQGASTSQYYYSPSSWSTSVLIQNNYINNTGNNGIVVSMCNAPVVEHNTVGNVGKKNIGHPHENVAWFVAIWGWNCHDSLFQYNEVYGTALGAGDGSAFDTDWGNSGTVIHQYNYTHDNAGGFKIGPIMIGTNPNSLLDVSRYNISENDGTVRTIELQYGVTEVYNNVFYNSSNSIKVNKFNGNSVTGDKVYNNIFVGNSSSVYATNSLIDYDYNVFYGHSGPTDPHKIVADPKFVNPGNGPNGYQLQLDSPCNDTGKIISGAGATDYFGNPLTSGNGTDRGAHEYVQIAVTGVTLDYTTATIGKSETKQLIATVNPSNATFKSVTWSSSNTSIATVDSNGLVTGIGVGTANITVTTIHGNYTATCAVTVKRYSPTKYYKITYDANSVLSIDSNTTGLDGVVKNITYTGADSQLWQIIETTDANTFKIVNKATGYSLKVNGTSNATGLQIIQSTYVNDNNMNFTIADSGSYVNIYSKLGNKTYIKSTGTSGGTLVTAATATTTRWDITLIS